MQSWQTAGAVSSVSFVRPAIRVATASYRWTSSTTTSTDVGLDVRHLHEVLDHALLHLGGDLGDVRSVVDDHVHLDVQAVHACTAPLLGVHAGHFRRRVRDVAGQHVGRDHAVAFHQFLDRRTSSVASGRAKKRNGTKVVPRPGETCITVPFRSNTPSG